jgi:5-bromo-4-chloroindolyl phosphate hydrolysis protein
MYHPLPIGAQIVIIVVGKVIPIVILVIVIVVVIPIVPTTVTRVLITVDGIVGTADQREEGQGEGKKTKQVHDAFPGVARRRFQYTRDRGRVKFRKLQSIENTSVPACPRSALGTGEYDLCAVDAG